VAGADWQLSLSIAFCCLFQWVESKNSGRRLLLLLVRERDTWKQVQRFGVLSAKADASPSPGRELSVAKVNLVTSFWLGRFASFAQSARR
jgi:hypothetical protein